MSTDEHLSALLRHLAEDRTDEGAWTKLVRKLWLYVLAIAVRRLQGNADLAEDAAQEVFIRLVRLCPFEELQVPEVFRAYLWRVAQNVCATLLAQQIRRSEVPLESERHLGTVSLDAKVDLNDLLDWLLDGLEDLDRQIIRLTAKGHSLAEIAEQLDISYSNAGVRRHRARKAIQALLKARGLSV